MEIKYNKLVGRIEDRYYYLDRVFQHNDNFKGAVGSIMRPVSFAEASARREEWDDDNELWNHAVANNDTDLGADEWHNMVIEEDGDALVFDLSYANTYGEDLIKFLNEDDIELVECVSGGRCFYTDMAWDELYNHGLWEMIKQYEAN